MFWENIKGKKVKRVDKPQSATTETNVIDNLFALALELITTNKINENASPRCKKILECIVECSSDEVKPETSLELSNNAIYLSKVNGNKFSFHSLLQDVVVLEDILQSKGKQLEFKKEQTPVDFLSEITGYDKDEIKSYLIELTNSKKSLMYYFKSIGFNIYDNGSGIIVFEEFGC